MKVRKYEVVFRHHHVMHVPWGPNDEVVEHLVGYPNVPLQNEVIQVRRLCHVTHKEEAREISGDQGYTFISQQKMGRPAREIRQTYAIREPMEEAPNGQTQYQRIPEGDEVFPGFYVWWSVAVEEAQTIHWEDMYYNEAGKYYITDGFRKPTQSVYGNKMFIVKFNTMLQCYQESFVERPRILLRCGGTLRYKREIMKVIIVCREEDLPDYPEFPTGGLNLAYDDNGKVTPGGILELRVKNGVSGSQRPDQARSTKYSWDTYGFAFYFPEQNIVMRYPNPEANNGVIRDIAHNYDRGGRRFAKCHRGICPNELPN